MKYLALQQRRQGKYRLRNDLLGAWDFFKATDGCYGVTCHTGDTAEGCIRAVSQRQVASIGAAEQTAFLT